MAYKAKSTKRRYEESLKAPLLFCYYEQKSGFDDYGMRYSYGGWFSCDSTIDLYISESELEKDDSERKLFIIGKKILENGEVDLKKGPDDTIAFEVILFDANNSSHWTKVFDDCIYNFKGGNTRHCHMALIWALYRTAWSEATLSQALGNMDKNNMGIVTNNIHNCLATFSIDKQSHIVNILKPYIPQVTQLVYPNIEEAIKSLSPSKDFKEYSLFDKVDFIFGFGGNEEEAKQLQTVYQTSRNGYIHFKYWYENPGYKLYNYNLVEEVFSYVSPLRQLSIVKRYLHDVRINVQTLDLALLTNLRDQRYKTFIDVRYFIENAGSNIELVAPMFCDAVLTIHMSNGKKIQDFNGILDFAVSHSNRSYPNIDLGIHNFLPSCDGGLKHNPAFLGFIHYSLVYEFDESLLTDENLRSTAEYILRNNATLQYHDCCAITKEEIDPETLKKCQTIISIVKETTKNGVVEKIKERSSCNSVSHERFNPDRWAKKGDNFDKVLALCIENIGQITTSFTFDAVSLPWLRNNLLNWGKQNLNFEYQNGEIPEEIRNNEFIMHLRRLYYRPITTKLFPYKGTFFASKKSLLGLWNMDGLAPNDQEFIKKLEERAQTAESPEVFKRTFEALKKMFPNATVFEDRIELPYSKKDLDAAKDFFYFRPHTLDNGQGNVNRDSRKFLAPKRRYNTFYCTPKLANTCEKVFGLDFFWCGSEECFCNVLDKQTLEKENDWHNYTIYHAAEIVGHSLLQVTQKGNIPLEMVSNFAAEVRQAERLYARLICRTCGHMIFSSRGSLLNGSRFFSCQNLACPQYRQEIYLSQYNTCKRGLIDSRDSKKCENGSVICPSCLSCCNDNLFDAIVAKHRRNGYIPQRLMDFVGNGHNNKRLFFCPDCATPIQTITIEEKEKNPKDGTDVIVKKTVRGCPQCKKSFEEELQRRQKAIGS